MQTFIGRQNTNVKSMNKPWFLLHNTSLYIMINNYINTGIYISLYGTPECIPCKTQAGGTPAAPQVYANSSSGVR